VCYLGESSKSFKVKTGLRQGVTSSGLFNLAFKPVVRYVMSMELVGNRTLMAFTVDIVSWDNLKYT